MESTSPQDDSRTLYIQDPILNLPFKFPNNYVRTSKYTLITFIPKNLLEQFLRLANVYFLLISCLQQIPGVSPTGRWTTLGPLVFVLFVTAVKEAIEDIRRHRQDNEINHRKVEVLKNESFEFIYWQDISVGDIVRVTNRTFIPADLVLLSTTEPQGICYIETANLDGETNLKIRQCIPETMEFDDTSKLSSLRSLKIKCEKPNEKLYQFAGTIGLNENNYPLGVKQTLLRGAMLRNTQSIIGVAVYTGHETKVMKNSTKSPVKRSNVERTTNYQIVFMFCLLLLMAVVCTIGYAVFQKQNSGAWYLAFDSNSSRSSGLAFITFIILFNNLIPISLYVSVEFVKFGQAFFINNDVLMYHEESDTPALARTSNLNEELGQVQYIFSDKTGTLTCNKMEFKRCTIGGVSYGEVDSLNADDDFNDSNSNSNHIKVTVNKSGKKETNNAEMEKVTKEFWTDDRLISDLKSNNEQSKLINEVFTLLSLCHTVIAETDKDDPKKIVYNASSPDEGALVKAAKYFGFEFITRTPKTITIRIKDDAEYKLLNVLEFTNDRKRMSVILKSPEGKIILYCKGADNVIYERLGSNNPYRDSTRKHLDEFASEGLRTLCLAKVELDPDVYMEWQKTFETASNVIDNRERELEKVAETIEKDLFLLGASAVEDKLQDGVPETIATLALARIKIWILTGDKQETAINIGKSCKLLTEKMNLMIINKDSKEETKDKINDYLGEYSKVENSENGNLALVIDGQTLLYALEEDIKLSLLKLGMKCKAVICCRVSPGQKALVVKLVRDNLKAITLAIGDGANDVSMIQAAHVGIGISGEEGLQAARASDYAIAQFRFLQRLLLIHGRNSYRRISKVILYSFYKNIILYFTQFWFAFFNGYSGQSLYERWTLACYNVLFTFFPVIAFGVLDKDVPDNLMNEFPQLYQSGIKGYHFNMKVFAGWVINAIFHSLVIFGFTTLICENELLNTNGETIGLWTVGTIMYTCCILVVTFKLVLEAGLWTNIFSIVVAVSLFLWLLWMLLYSLLNLLGSYSAGIGKDLLFVPYHFLNTAPFYFCIIIVPIIALFRDFTWKFLYRSFFSRSYHIIQEVRYLRSKRETLRNSIDE